MSGQGRVVIEGERRVGYVLGSGAEQASALLADAAITYPSTRAALVTARQRIAQPDRGPWRGCGWYDLARGYAVEVSLAPACGGGWLLGAYRYRVHGRSIGPWRRLSL